ncbi:VOC family protein [Nocardia sp. CA-151230]|uniref:VOC family protein n=1 Tax=Nocardia sp. CA-151230 TaxID=3239982 RepID=UPI003D9027CF
MSITEDLAGAELDKRGAQVRLRMSELVLKSRDITPLRDWYGLLLGRDPFLERQPAPDADKSKVDGQERASDVRLAFFTVHEGEHPYNQILALFEVGDLAVDPTGPGMHHFQFMLGSLNELAAKFEQFSAHGIRPHRCANHGPITSFYYRDPDRNIIELSCANFDSYEAEQVYFKSEKFRRNPSGVELEPDDFITRFRANEPLETLLAIPD